MNFVEKLKSLHNGKRLCVPSAKDIQVWADDKGVVWTESLTVQPPKPLGHLLSVTPGQLEHFSEFVEVREEKIS